MRRIGMVIFPGFEILDMAALAVFELANHNAGKELYHVDMLSETGGLVASSYGVAVDSRRFASPRFDTVVVAGAGPPPPSFHVLVKFFCATPQKSPPVSTNFPGALLLPAAWLPPCPPAATPLEQAQAVQSPFP